MQAVSHQTVRLSRGKHRSPDSGMCVMELAATLAGEPFSDHPRSVCPVIAGLLRVYNDNVDDDLRQDLIPYAARVVGTRGDEAVVAARAARCLGFVQELIDESPRWLPRRRLLNAQLHSMQAGHAEDYGTWAARSIRRSNERTHAAVLALVDSLIELHEDSAAPDVLETPAEPVRPTVGAAD